mmetsp:Transcript_14300/g.42660  ORF Transcript_14300/g.42660 Transcript_14300/m.42660 type:complete len:208 (+) Transcript_14300:366-989(+)
MRLVRLFPQPLLVALRFLYDAQRGLLQAALDLLEPLLEQPQLLRLRVHCPLHVPVEHEHFLQVHPESVVARLGGSSNFPLVLDGLPELARDLFAPLEAVRLVVQLMLQAVVAGVLVPALQHMAQQGLSGGAQGPLDGLLAVLQPVLREHAIPDMELDRPLLQEPDLSGEGLRLRGVVVPLDQRLLVAETSVEASEACREACGGRCSG